MSSPRDPEPLSVRSSAEGPRIFEGIAGSTGVAIGPALVVDTGRLVVHRHIRRYLADEELTRFDEAVEVAAHSLREVAARMRSVATRAEASILEAYVLMVEDETLREDVARRIRIDAQCAEWALECAVQEMSAELRRSEDPYLAERSHDIEFVMERILGELSGQRALPVPGTKEAPCIIVARDLSPAATAQLGRDRVLGLVTETGTRSSHTAIIARALEIPAVVGVRDILTHAANGQTLIVDGVRGRVALTPSAAMVAEAEDRARRRSEKTHAQRKTRDLQAHTQCGAEITLRANIELPEETEIALSEGAQGIGLYRTEFLYINRMDLPSEDEQYETYRRVVSAAAPWPVTLRTFDIGGDKVMATFGGRAEKNPALGRRAVRLGLEQPEVFKVQLRAMVRASAHGRLGIMVPMVTALAELRAVRRLLEEAIGEVDRAGHPRAAVLELGMMVEVPSTAILAREFAREAEFLSIGTNDLVQYTLAVDRTSRELAHLSTFFDPAVLWLIDSVIRAGREEQRPVTLCGAMASDPLAAVLLLGMGLRELSMEAAAIPDVKEALSRVTVAEAAALADVARQKTVAADVELCLAQGIASRLADLLDNDG